jgi:hypothetical protein
VAQELRQAVATSTAVIFNDNVLYRFLFNIAHSVVEADFWGVSQKNTCPTSALIREVVVIQLVKVDGDD